MSKLLTTVEFMLSPVISLWASADIAGTGLIDVIANMIN